jgi:benzoyl-CoA reductase/2-hydroxyglutaryl-CoA dehydratase subunit BcrC/BadD/HgdB
MTNERKEKIGYACAYTPLPLIHAAGYSPYRILPVSEAPDRAGAVLHDNLCPHIKRILDRALDQDLPELTGVVFVNCCDAMRRLADGWRKAQPDHKIFLLELPYSADEADVSHFAEELSELAGALSEWRGRTIPPERVGESVDQYNDLAAILDTLMDRLSRGVLGGGAQAMQDFFNMAATDPLDQSLIMLREIAATPEGKPNRSGVPVLVFGNVLADPEAFSLFEKSGVHITAADLCTGSRAFSPTTTGNGDVFRRLAEDMLSRPRCGRTFNPANPGQLAEDIVAKAKECGAKGVIAHTIKFCDPYNSRLPGVREALREADLPMLALEGDCTMRSFGQQRTRIEAFIEMLR